MFNIEFKIDSKGKKYAIWLEDLDIVILRESDMEFFQKGFDKLDKTKGV